MRTFPGVLAPCFLLLGCGPGGDQTAPPDPAAPARAMADAAGAGPNQEAAEPPAHVAPPEPSPARDRLDPAPLVLGEWSRAKNRKACAPAAFAVARLPGAVARRANFSGGWAVAFDLPETRSAYGLAGTGLLPGDSAPAGTSREALQRQWPYFVDLRALPQPAYAGYGLEGARPYPADAPDSLGANALAYVRIAGQDCVYNVWSRLGRAHLETLLDGLRMVPVAGD